METKICSKCKIEKSTEDFNKCKSNKDGLNYTCKLCRNLYYESNKEEICVKSKQYQQDNKEEIAVKSKQYRQDNKEEIAVKRKLFYEENKKEISINQKQYREDNKEKIVLYQKRYQQDNKEKKAIYNKQYREENKEKISIKNKQYREENKEKIAIDKKEYIKNKRNNDLNFKLRSNISRAINLSLKNGGFSKNGKSCGKYLPYTFEELKVHIKNQFELWMTWDNWGVYNSETWDDNDSSTWTWQIDHIIPHSKFIYASMEDQSFRDCWALSNLRPYSAKQNISDGNRR